MKHIVKREDPPSIIPELREITSELFRDPNTIAVKTTTGRESIFRSLMARNKVGVVDGSIPEGDFVPEHFHKDPIVEYLIVYEGRICVLCTESGEMTEAGPGECVRIESDRRHLVEALEGYGNVRMIGIAIPRDERFPGEVEEED